MKTITRAGWVLCVFLVGCAVGGASHIVVSSATADSAGAPKWSYKCLLGSPTPALIKKSNRMGSRGWEMVAGVAYDVNVGDQVAWCFKRPL